MGPIKILVVDDDPSVCEAISEFLQSSGYDVSTTGSMKSCLELLSRNSFAVVVIDYFLPDGDALQLLPRIQQIAPDTATIVLTGRGTIELAVSTIKLGAEQFLTKPVQLGVMEGIIRKIVETRQTMRRNAASRASGNRWARDPFFGESAKIVALRNAVSRIVGTDRPILIQGETGTGKGVLANWLHQNGPRADEAFVDVNCAGLPRDLVESELFGHEKGAFTGALTSKPGLLETGHLGTVFLDEIGDLDLALQPKLLKVLEEKRLRRLGQVQERAIDIHLIAATHRDLQAMMQEEKFRADLFFRINTITLSIPPLRERYEDIPLLADHFLRQLERDLGRGPFRLSKQAQETMLRYSWPGNIRELRNVLERAALICATGEIEAADLNLPATRQQASMLPNERLTLAEIERRYVNLVLEQEGGSVDRAALRLEIPRSTLYAKLREWRVTSS